MKIDVTQADIDRGVRRDGERCPVALALNRATGRAWAVAFSLALADDEPLTALPRVAANWQAAFDAGRPVQPFSFDFEESPP